MVVKKASYAVKKHKKPTECCRCPNDVFCLLIYSQSTALSMILSNACLICDIDNDISARISRQIRYQPGLGPKGKAVADLER